MRRAGRGNLGRDGGRRTGHAHERRAIRYRRGGHGLRLLGFGATPRALPDEGGRRRLAARPSLESLSDPVARRQQHHAFWFRRHHHAEARRSQSECYYLRKIGEARSGPCFTRKRYGLVFRAPKIAAMTTPSTSWSRRNSSSRIATARTRKTRARRSAWPGVKGSPRSGAILEEVSMAAGGRRTTGTTSGAWLATIYDLSREIG